MTLLQLSALSAALAQLDPLRLVRSSSGNPACLSDLDWLQAMGDEKGAFQQMLARQCEAQTALFETAPPRSPGGLLANFRARRMGLPFLGYTTSETMA